MSSRIVFNGQEYNSLNYMPPDLRQAYEAAVRMVSQPNSGPDSPRVKVSVSTNTRFVYQVKTAYAVNIRTNVPPSMPIASATLPPEMITTDRSNGRWLSSPCRHARLSFCSDIFICVEN